MTIETTASHNLEAVPPCCPKVSVVTVTYNCARMLEATMRSVLEQTYSNIEYVLIDGESTDGTVSIIQRYESRLAYWISEPDGGVFDAMNKAFPCLTGEWVVFMNAGDEFADEAVVERMMQTPWDSRVGAVHGTTLIDTPSGRRVMPESIPFYETTRRFRAMGFCHQSVFVRRMAIGDIRFDLSFRIAADYKMLDTMWREGWQFRRVDWPVAVIDTTGLSAQNRSLQRKEAARISGCEKELCFRIWTRYKSLRAGVKRLIT